MVQQYSTINHLNTHVHDSEATLVRHVARFDAIATSCGSATPWHSLNRLPVGYCIESDTSAMINIINIFLKQTEQILRKQIKMANTN